jgi:hypothetical protein
VEVDAYGRVTRRIPAAEVVEDEERHRPGGP